MKIFPGVPANYMPTKSMLFISTVLLIAVSSGSYLSMKFVDHIFFITCSMCYFGVAKLLGIYLFTIFTVISGHDWKYPFLIALIHVDLTGMNAAAWRYLTEFD